MNRLKHNGKRIVALLLCAIILAGILPMETGLTPQASASWSKRYVDKMKEWGIMSGTGGGNMAENRTVTRAELMTMLNRAYGFQRTGPIPFTDVPRSAWFYQDICIAYNEGIMSGTSSTKASPNMPVTREQALLLIANAMRLEASTGEVTEFTDGRNFSPWSAPYARSALLAGIISGRPDGSFGPKDGMTRGEVACVLYNALGTLINKPGDHSLGGVFGRVTINTAHVTLRDTVIAGDLYLTGGVGLGDVCLDNVRVYGKIIVAGGGEAQLGEDSILLNNVEAQVLQIDPNVRQIVSIRALGSTNIGETLVKGPAYIQDDVRDNSKGLRNIYLDGPKDTAFTLAGNLKNIVNRTPGSTLTIGDTGQGSVSSVTVDEKAVNSTLNLEINATVDKVNLDTASKITGAGDIGELTVTTNGSSCEILPDKVTVRPGVTTTIGDMDNVDSEIAKEISADPRLLAGYPAVRNVAPATADGYFSVNKAGTIYWAVTNAATGALTDDDAESLISPSEYGSGMLLFGSIKAETSKTEYNTRITGLEAGGTYYLSAMLVDAHGRYSPVKAQKILTPDGTVPALTGSPQFTDRTPTRTDANAELPFGEIVDLQATVMANKTCDLYYVLLASGSTAPQTSEFLSASFVDPYGYGRIHLIKNTMDSFKINEVDLNLDDVVESLGEVEENTSYDLYLWLTDADGSKSSKITKHTVKTKDITPPKFNGDMFQTTTQATSVKLSNSVNENSTVYWVAVPSGAEYPKPETGSSTDPEFLRSEYAKMQIIYGRGGFKSGKLTAKENVDFSITISGLAKESAYDVYYVAVDAANNCSDPIQKFTAHTLDSTPPTARQEFENVPDDSPNTPYADSTINIIFSEDIRYKQPSGSSAEPYAEPNLLALYTNYAEAKKLNPNSPETKEAEALYTGALRDMIILYSEANHRPLPERTSASAPNEDWGVDYRNVRVFREGATLVVSFINSSDLENSSLNLESGARYSFQLKNIADESESHNVMNTTSLPVFETVSAQVILNQYEGPLTLKAYGLDEDFNIDTSKPIESTDNNNDLTTDIPIDISFTAEPRSTSTTADGVYWDMLFWFDTSVEFEVFTRKKGTENWTQVGGDDATLSISVPQDANDLRGTSVVLNLSGGSYPDYQYINAPYKNGGIHCGLNDAKEDIYEYALHFVRIGNKMDRSTFTEEITGQVTYVTGSASTLASLANQLGRPGAFDRVTSADGGSSNFSEITAPKNLDGAPRKLYKQFSDSRAPQLRNNAPSFTPTDTGVTMSVTLDRVGNVYYIISPVDKNGTAALAPQLNDNNVPSEHLLHIAASGWGCYVDKTTGDVITDPTNSGGEYNHKTLTTAKPSEDDKDSHKEHYYFDYPNPLAVFNPKGAGLTTSQLITGSYSNAGLDAALINVTGLSPETKYYVYMVTQGGSDILSEVNVYQFTTKATSRPIITLNRDGSNVTVRSNERADINWLVIPDTGSSMNSLLTADFTEAMGSAGIAALKEYYKNDQSRIDKYMGEATDQSGAKIPFRVIDALMENVAGSTASASAGCLFDLFASASYKSQVAAYIREAAAGGTDTSSTASGDFSLPKPNGSQTVNCNENGALSPATNYYFLAVGNTPAAVSGGTASDDGFRAIYPVIMTDTQHPQVIFCAGNSLRVDKDGNISGTLVVRFSERLYLYEGSGDPRAIVSGKTPTQSEADVKVSVTSLPSNVDIIEAPTSAPQTSVSDISFNFNNALGPRVDILFSPYLSDVHNNRGTQALSIVVQVKNIEDDQGNIIDRQVEVTIPRAWDARTN
ncbi:MAG: S-layer homology domain-containing protein [Acutalibacter sp.]|jgi:hypothetical protein|nr:S-layer homology domain-containing protein [Acutalibacter sp.]